MSGFKKALKEAANDEKQQIKKASSTKATPASNSQDEAPKEQTKKKSNAGRKRLLKEDQKKQVVLTLKPTTFNALLDAGHKEVRRYIEPDGTTSEKETNDYRQLLSKYIDEHIEDIVNELKQ